MVGESPGWIMVKAKPPVAFERLAGKGEKQDSHNRRCPDCGRWFHPAGWWSHREACDTKDNPYFRFNEDRSLIEWLECEECSCRFRWDQPLEEQQHHSYYCEKGAGYYE